MDRETGPWSKPALLRRFRRIEGQARGLQKMVADDRDAAQLLMQIASVRQALHGAATLVLGSYLAAGAETTLRADNPDGSQAALQQAIDIFCKWAR